MVSFVSSRGGSRNGPGGPGGESPHSLRTYMQALVGVWNMFGPRVRARARIRVGVIGQDKKWKMGIK